MITNHGAKLIYATFNENTCESLHIIVTYKEPKMQIDCTSFLFFKNTE